MKIGIIAHLKHPIKAPFESGLEVFTYQITKLLAQRGHEVILFASSKSDDTLPVYPILSDDFYNDVSGTRISGVDGLPPIFGAPAPAPNTISAMICYATEFEIRLFETDAIF